MSTVSFSFEHRQPLAEARERLKRSVAALDQQAGFLVHRIAWLDDGSRAVLSGTGFEVRVWVDERAVHVEGDVPPWLKMLAHSPLARLRNVLETNFQKRLDD
jgi:hypothetical protein